MKSGTVRQQLVKEAKSQDECQQFVLCRRMYVRFCTKHSSDSLFPSEMAKAKRAEGLRTCSMLARLIYVRHAER
jgi:hypothetical protein